MFPFPQALIGFGNRISISTIGNFGTVPNGAVVSAVWPTAKKVMYCPIRVPAPMTVAQLYVGVGAAVSGNIAVGLYSLDGTRLINSGSVAQSGSVTALQVFDVTDTLIGAGVFYLAVTLDNTTGALQRVSVTAPMDALAGVRQETTGSFGLPATASFADAVDGYIPEVGLTGASTI